MMRISYHFFTLALLTSCILYTSTLNAEKLSVPEIFNLLKVDGNAYSKSMFVLDVQLDLEPGRHSLELQYDEYFEFEDGEGHVFIKSEPFIITFLVSDGHDLILSRPSFDDESSARIYAENPEVIINRIDKQLTPTHFETSESRSVEIPVTQEVIMVTEEQLEETSDAPVKNLTMLKYWWQQASNKERKKFKLYIKNQ